MSDMMTFPATVEEFMEQYKIVDTEKIYTNGAELIPIFRMMQWFEHVSATDTISRQAGIDGINRLFCPIGGCNFDDEEQKKLYDNGVDDALQVIEELPAAQPVHNTTLSDVLTYFDSLKENEDAWTEFCACLECRGWDIVPAKRYNDEAREIFMAIVYDELYSDGDNNRANRIIDAADEYAERRVDDALQTIEELSHAQPQPCEDAVSRKDCLKALSNMMDTDGFRNGWAVSRANVECMLKSMPPVTPKQRTGYWYPVGMVEVVGGESAQWGSAIAYHRCSECDGQALCEFGQEVLSKWCPHCGAKMGEDAE